MAAKIKTREINIVEESGAFTTFFKRFTGEKSEFDFEGISTLRKLLSNERAKMLGRDFKSVSNDIKLLERFGFIEMIAEKTGKRNRLRPILAVNEINIKLKI